MEDWDCDDSAFTEHELAHGIRRIYGTEGSHSPRSTEGFNRAINELVEFESQVTLDSLSADLVKNFASPYEIVVEYTGQAAKLFANNYGHLDQAGVIVDSLSPDECKLYCVHIRRQPDYVVSLRDFLEAMAVTQIPVQVDFMWFVWDGMSARAVQCSKVSASTVPKAVAAADTTPTPLAFEILNRAISTMDHGYKPMLVHRDDIPNLLDKQAVPTPDPACLFESEMLDYSLAYFTSSGQISTISLLNALTETTYLATRGGTYTLCEGVLTPALNKAWRVVSAYHMALKMSVEMKLEPRVFVRKSQASAFEAIYRNTTLDEICNYPKKSVYLTDGNHPLDISDKKHGCEWGSGLVTTYELYDQARKNLQTHGIQCLDFNQHWFDLPDCGSGIVFD